jgi:predicted nucleic acid-binding protein
VTDKFVLDTSVVMTWCFEDEKSRYGDRVLDRLADSIAAVPSVWPLEVANVLVVAERLRRLNRADSVRFMSLLQTLPIFVEQFERDTVFGPVFALAAETGLTSYDASYLQLAMRDGLPIATLDRALRRAAKKLQVPLVEA